MDPEHRKIIKQNHCFLSKNVDFDKIYMYLLDYRMFNKPMWEEIHSTSDVLELLPTRGPAAFRHFIEILRKTDYNAEADCLEKQSSRFDSSVKLFYKMTTKPLGYCLIINNMKFNHKDLLYRVGSNVDANSLQKFFEKADFNVEIKSDLTSEEMRKCLRKFSEKDFLLVDSMFLIIMSHGGNLNNKEFIYGTDGNPISYPPNGYLFKDDIYEVFNNKNCVDLQTKPKVFIFIACRGEGKDYGVEKSRPKESLDSAKFDPVLPEFSDMLVINSTLPKNVTVRDHEKGTYFCQALVDVLNECYTIYDLETMIKLVNQKLDGKVSEIFRIVQASTVETTMWKKKIMLCHKK